MCRKYLFFLTLCAVFAGSVSAQEVSVVRVQELIKRVHQDQSEVLVLNFWATWCRPCVEEMPHFQRAAKEYKEKKVRFIFVSLDQSEKLPRVKEFLRKNKYDMEVLLLDETDFNRVLPMIHPKMMGIIPATLFLAKKKKGVAVHDSFSEVKLVQNMLSEKELTDTVGYFLGRAE